MERHFSDDFQFKSVVPDFSRRFVVVQHKNHLSYERNQSSIRDNDDKKYVFEIDN